MFNKKILGFTIAEILVALTLIGVIASITTPVLYGKIEDTRYRAAYRKAYATIAHICYTLKNNGELPKSSEPIEGFKFFKNLVANLEVEGYANSGTSEANVIKRGKKFETNDIKQGVTYNGVLFGEGSDSAGTFSLATTNMQWSPWVIASDGIAYSVKHTSQACKTKGVMNASSAVAHTQWLNSCVLIAVDLNGLTKGPNTIEAQVQDFDKQFLTTKKVAKLTGDIYFIYVGRDGVSSGSTESTLTGRIIAGLD